MNAPHKHDPVRAGSFVLLGVVAFTLAIFLLGQKSALFSRTSTLIVSFDDISGLAVGAPVRLAGLEVGSVASLELSPNLERKTTEVRLVVQSRYLPRIRANSEAFIDSNGLLGDKIVNISLGDPRAAALSDGATLRAGKSASLDTLAATMGRALGSAASVVEQVDKLVADDRTVQLRDDLARGAGSLAALLAQIEGGDGLAHRLLYDPSLGAHAGAVVDRAHELAEGEAKRAVSDLAGAAAELHALLAHVREGQGVLHALVYDPSQAGFLRDLNGLTSTLHRIVQDVDKGQGTVGGLLRDPTVYEDLKTLLGNVQRNVLFKALVRYTIERDDLRQVDGRPRVEPEQAPGPALAR